MANNAENENAKSPNEEKKHGTNRDDRSGFLKHFRETWNETVGNYATDEGETRNLFSWLVGFGTLSREEAKKLFQEASQKIEQNRLEFDTRIDESIKKATARLSTIPPEEIDKLKKKLSEIEERITAIEEGPH